MVESSNKEMMSTKCNRGEKFRGVRWQGDKGGRMGRNYQHGNATTLTITIFTKKSIAREVEFRV